MKSEHEENWIPIPRDFAAPLARHLGMRRGALGSLLLGTGEGGAPVETAVAWLNQKPVEDREIIGTVLRALAAPALVAQVMLMLDDDALLNILSAVENTDAASLVFLVGDDERSRTFRVSTCEDREAYAHTLCAYLDTEIPPWFTDVNFALTLPEMLVLFAVIDLFCRSRHVALLDHSAPVERFLKGDIGRCLVEGLNSPDPRWLVPFFGQMLEKNFTQPTENEVAAAIGGLVAKGVLAADKESYTLSIAAEVLAASAYRRTAAMGVLVTGATPDGVLAMQRALFLRSGRLLWFMDIGGADGKTAAIGSVTSEMALNLVRELLRPVGIPPATESTIAAQAPAAAAACARCHAPLEANTRFCPQCGAPREQDSPVPPPLPAAATCTRCGAPLGPGKKFCMNCGAPASASR